MIRFLSRLFRLFTRTVLAVMLVASMSLTFLSLTVAGVQATLSGALSAVGVSTVMAREVAERQTRRAVTKKIARQTSRRVSVRLQRGAARNSASVFGEAVPIVGIGIIAGALALEIKESCDTARDMTALEAAMLSDDDPQAAFDAAAAAFDCKTLIPNEGNLPGRDEIWQAVKASPRALWESSAEYYSNIKEVDWSKFGNDTIARMTEFWDWMAGGQAE